MNQKIGDRLRARRYELKLGLEEVLEGTEIDPSTLSRYENGQTDANFLYVGKIADRLNLSLDYLYKGKLDKLVETQNELSKRLNKCLGLSEEDMVTLIHICDKFIDTHDHEEVVHRKRSRKKYG